MGNKTSRVICCIVAKREPEAGGVLDEGLGHSFYYVRRQFQCSSSSVSSSSITDNSFSVPSGEYLLSQNSDTALNFNPSHEQLQKIPPTNVQDESIFPEKSFKSIFGSSVSANTSNPRSLLSHDQFNAVPVTPFDRAAAFESTSSFSALPLQPVPKGVTFSWSASSPLSMSGPLEKGALSGPIERGFMSGPLERGFMSGPLERSHVSGSLDPVDRKLFSAPIGAQYSGYMKKRKKFLSGLVQTLGKTVGKALSKRFQRALFKNPSPTVAPLPRRFNLANDKAHDLSSQEMGCGSEDSDVKDRSNLQWAQAMAGEDRTHIVLSEKNGWLFVGIYDGFNGPDATDFLMSNLYPEVYRQLRGLLWDSADSFESSAAFAARNLPKMPRVDRQRRPKNQNRVSAHEILGILDSWQKDISSAYGKKKAGEVGQRKDDEKGNEDARDCQISSAENPAGTISFEQTTNSKQADSIIADNSHLNNENKNADLTSLSIKQQQDHGHDHKNSKSELDMPALDPSETYGSLPDRHQHNLKKLSLTKNDLKSTTAVHHRPRAIRGFDSEVRHKVNSADHQAVLRALSRALKATEESYVDMADKVVADNPELALVGSCVLVMLMKDEDVYVMNVGDSRALLARQASKDSFEFPSLLSREQLPGQHTNHKENQEWIVARNSMLRMELERIIEEPVMEREAVKNPFDPSEMAPPPVSCSLDSVQLTSDHSTSIPQEVRRVVSEHPEDEAPIFNHRVKGRLKVTRAFGAGFLKKPEWNDALLEMFRIDYVGTAPYISCSPALCHHKLGPRDRFLVLSSDGLYQYLTNEEVISHIEWFMERFPEGDPAQYLIEELLFRAAKKAGMDFHELLEIPQGDRRKYHDDVSVMVISVEGRVWRSSR